MSGSAEGLEAVSGLGPGPTLGRGAPTNVQAQIPAVQALSGMLGDVPLICKR